MKKGDWLMMLERHMVLTLALEKRITQRQAAQELGLSLCHTKRLLRRLKQTKGDPHSLDYHRTHPAPNRTPEEVREQVVALKRRSPERFQPPHRPVALGADRAAPSPLHRAPHPDRARGIYLLSFLQALPPL